MFTDRQQPKDKISWKVCWMQVFFGLGQDILKLDRE